MTTAPRKDIDTWGIEGARWFSSRSPCCRRQVGALVVKNGRVVGGGFNGPSKNLPPRTTEPGPLQCVRIGIKSGTEPHKVCCDHAESNACQFTDRRDAEGATLYCTDSPCRICAGLIVNAGIVRVVVAAEYPDADGLALLRAAGVPLEVWTPPVAAPPAAVNGAPFDEAGTVGAEPAPVQIKAPEGFYLFDESCSSGLRFGGDSPSRTFWAWRADLSDLKPFETRAAAEIRLRKMYALPSIRVVDAAEAQALAT